MLRETDRANCNTHRTIRLMLLKNVLKHSFRDMTFVISQRAQLPLLGSGGLCISRLSHVASYLVHPILRHLIILSI